MTGTILHQEVCRLFT